MPGQKIFLVEGNYQSSPSFSLAGTSITLGLSMILAVLKPIHIERLSQWESWKKFMSWNLKDLTCSPSQQCQWSRPGSPPPSECPCSRPQLVPWGIILLKGKKQFCQGQDILLHIRFKPDPDITLAGRWGGPLMSQQSYPVWSRWEQTSNNKTSWILLTN